MPLSSLYYLDVYGGIGAIDTYGLPSLLRHNNKNTDVHIETAIVEVNSSLYDDLLVLRHFINLQGHHEKMAG